MYIRSHKNLEFV